MAETRKSDFTGDVYGEWAVSGRAPAQNKKRAWHVVNPTTGETRVVLQTALADLGAVGTPIESPWEAGLVGTQVSDNPFDIVFSGSLYADPDNLPLDEHDEPTLPAIGSAALTAGPGECQHGIDIKACPEHWALLGERSKEAHEKYPQNFRGSAEITASVLAANAAAKQAKGEQTAGTVVASTDGVMDWSHHLEPGEARSEPEDIEGPVLLGENADENVTEAALDVAAKALPKDPVRAAVRKTMAQLFDYKNDIEAIHAQLGVAHERLSALMDSVDQILKAVVTK